MNNFNRHRQDVLGTWEYDMVTDMKIYTLRIVLRGISPMIWRRVRIPEATSLAELHLSLLLQLAAKAVIFSPRPNNAARL